MCKVPFLSTGEDLGNREVLDEGSSALSGDYVVEDVDGESEQKFRRLIFLSNKNGIQSEARLVTGDCKTKLFKSLEFSFQRQFSNVQVFGPLYNVFCGLRKKISFDLLILSPLALVYLLFYFREKIARFTLKMKNHQFTDSSIIIQ